MQFYLLLIYQMFLTVLYFYSQFRQYCDTNCLHPQWISSATFWPFEGPGVCLSSLYHWLACCRRQYISNTPLHFKDTCWCQSCIISNYCIYCGNCIKRNEGNLFLVGSSIKVQDDTLFPKHIELSNNVIWHVLIHQKNSNISRCFGCLMVYTLGYFIRWQRIARFAILVPIAACIVAIFTASESPVYLVSQNKVTFANNISFKQL